MRELRTRSGCPALAVLEQGKLSCCSNDGIVCSDLLSVGSVVMEEALGIQRREEASPWRELSSLAPPSSARRDEEEQRISIMCVFACFSME